jgi:hypothetical protein
MTKAILALALLVMAGVVVVLGRGMGTIGKPDADSARFSNRMMRWRVGLQFLAVALIVLVTWLATPS